MITDVDVDQRGPGAEVDDGEGDKLFGDELARRWPEFVNCPRRAEAMRHFFSRVLRAPGRVLDCAMGTGCDAVTLAQLGFCVVGNEIDEGLRKVAASQQGFARAGITVTAVDWRELGQAFSEGEFDAVLLTGNSLCLLEGARDRLRTLENIRRVCRSGGVAVVDERNFRYIRGSRAEILRGHFRYRGQVMFCGTRIAGRPITIEEEQIRFGYFDVATKRLIGTLDMYPGAEDEMISNLRLAGFKDVGVYSDLTEGHSDEADFYTYVAR